MRKRLLLSLLALAFVSITPAQSATYWYYCRDTRVYFPYVQSCASPWQEVRPQPPDLQSPATAPTQRAQPSMSSPPTKPAARTVTGDNEAQEISPAPTTGEATHSEQARDPTCIAAECSNEKPAGSTCYMGECGAIYIVKMFRESNGVIEVHIKDRAYNFSNPGFTFGEPTYSTNWVSCDSPGGYIEDERHVRIAEPNPQPSHATEPAEKLWAAACGVPVPQPGALIPGPPPIKQRNGSTPHSPAVAAQQAAPAPVAPTVSAGQTYAIFFCTALSCNLVQHQDESWQIDKTRFGPMPSVAAYCEAVAAEYNRNMGSNRADNFEFRCMMMTSPWQSIN